MSDAWVQIVRFWSFEDRAVQTAVAGVLLLAISCGSLGCFIVLRRLSLMGDSLGHAVLPGVCLGFMVTWTKDLRWIFAGAVVAALLASWLIGMIERYTRLKSDVALGLVLSGFFGMGLVLLARLEKTAGDNQTGLNQLLLGQAAAISERDLWLIGGLSIVIVAGVAFCFKELAVTSFDEGFATAIGIPARLMHYLLMSLTALAIVISLQAVGVVLLSALLITPAATALLLTDRLKVMVLLSVLFASVGGVLGLNLSFLGRDLPTGPFVVAEQLPDSNPIKPIALDYIKRYEAKYGAGSRSYFGAVAWDAYLWLDAAVPVAMKKAKPGTAEFRTALRDAIEGLKDLPAAGAIYTLSPTDHTGTDHRARVMVRVENGAFKLVR
jgi:manganese/zinc/iron transport system permease protein